MPIQNETDRSEFQKVMFLERYIENLAAAGELFWADLQHRVKRSHEHFTGQQSRIGSLKEQYDIVVKQQNQAEHSIQQIKDTVLSQDKSLEMIKNQSEKVKRDIAHVNQNQKSIQKEIEDLDINIQKTRVGIAEFQKETVSIKNSVEEVTDQISANQRKMDLIERSIESHQGVNKEIKEQIDEMSQNCKHLAQAQNDCEEKIKKNQEGIDHLQAGLRQFDVDVEKVKGSEEVLKKMVEPELVPPENNLNNVIQASKLVKRTLWVRIKSWFSSLYEKVKLYLFKLWMLHLITRLVKKSLGPFAMILKPFQWFFRWIF